MKKKTRKKLLRTLSIAAVALQTIEFAVTMFAKNQKGKRKKNLTSEIIKHPGSKKKKSQTPAHS